MWICQKTDYNRKIKDIEDKIPDITNLATNNTLTAIENKISDVNTLVKKADYGNKVKETKIKYFTTSDYNELTSIYLMQR